MLKTPFVLVCVEKTDIKGKTDIRDIGDRNDKTPLTRYGREGLSRYGLGGDICHLSALLYDIGALTRESGKRLALKVRDD